MAPQQLLLLSLIYLQEQVLTIFPWAPTQQHRKEHRMSFSHSCPSRQAGARASLEGAPGSWCKLPSRALRARGSSHAWALLPYLHQQAWQPFGLRARTFTSAGHVVSAATSQYHHRAGTEGTSEPAWLVCKFLLTKPGGHQISPSAAVCTPSSHSGDNATCCPTPYCSRHSVHAGECQLLSTKGRPSAALLCSGR